MKMVMRSVFPFKILIASGILAAVLSYGLFAEGKPIVHEDVYDLVVLDGGNVFQTRKLLSSQIDTKSLAYKISQSVRDDKKSLPRRDLQNKKVPNNVEFNVEYLQSIGVLAVPGVVIAILFLLYGTSLFVFSICYPNFCACNQFSGTQDEMQSKEKRIYIKMAMNSVSIVFFCCVVFATAPYFSSGVVSVINTIETTVDITVTKVDSINNATVQLSVDIPHRMDLIVQNLTVVNQLIDLATNVTVELESTNTQLNIVMYDLNSLKIPAGTQLSQTQGLITSLTSTMQDASDVLTKLQVLIHVVKLNVLQIYTDMLSTIDDKKKDVNDITGQITSELGKVVIESKDIQHSISTETNKVETYQEITSQGTAAIFILPFLGCLFTVAALYLKKKYLIIIGFSLSLLSGILLWLLFALYLPTGVLMGDYCDEPYDILARGLEYVKGEPGIAIKGCFARQSIFDSLGYSDELVVSNYFDYESYVGQYFTYRRDYNVTELSDYTNDVAALLEYNLYLDIPSITPASYGFDESSIQSEVNQINDITVPCCQAYYTTSNVSSMNPQTLPGVPNQQTRDQLDTMKSTTLQLMATNVTVYNNIQELTDNLTRIQNDLNSLANNVSILLENVDSLEATLRDVDICVLGVAFIINQTQRDINNIADLCDCNYVANEYDILVTNMCVTTISGVDVLWLCSVIIAGGMFTHLWLSRSAYKCIRIQAPSESNSDDDYYVAREHYNKKTKTFDRGSKGKIPSSSDVLLHTRSAKSILDPPKDNTKSKDKELTTFDTASDIVAPSALRSDAHRNPTRDEFALFSTKLVSKWLESQDIRHLVANVNKYKCTGGMLLNASPDEMERLFGMDDGPRMTNLVSRLPK